MTNACLLLARSKRLIRSTSGVEAEYLMLNIEFQTSRNMNIYDWIYVVII